MTWWIASLVFAMCAVFLWAVFTPEPSDREEP